MSEESHLLGRNSGPGPRSSPLRPMKGLCGLPCGACARPGLPGTLLGVAVADMVGTVFCKFVMIWKNDRKSERRMNVLTGGTLAKGSR